MEETRKNKKEEDIVKETWGSMTAGKKIEYLWMYYKGWLAGAVCVVLAVCLGVTMYKGRHTNVFLNVIVVGGDNLKAEWLAEEFSQEPVETATIEQMRRVATRKILGDKMLSPQ